jgi:hypothetical protein
MLRFCISNLLAGLLLAYAMLGCCGVQNLEFGFRTQLNDSATCACCGCAQPRPMKDGQVPHGCDFECRQLCTYIGHDRGPMLEISSLASLQLDAPHEHDLIASHGEQILAPPFGDLPPPEPLYLRLLSLRL